MGPPQAQQWHGGLGVPVGPRTWGKPNTALMCHLRSPQPWHPHTLSCPCPLLIGILGPPQGTVTWRGCPSRRSGQGPANTQLLRTCAGPEGRKEGGRERGRERPSVHSQDVKEMPCQPQALQPQVVGVTVPTAHSKHKLLRWGVTGLRPPLQESASLSGFCLRSRHTGFVPNDGCKT